MKDAHITIERLKDKINKFIIDRDWGKYHSPKNLAMSLAIEAAELMEKFQWLTTEESHQYTKNKKKLKAIEEEIADIAIYVIDFCNLFNIDLSKAIIDKLKKNAKKYPVSLAKGKAHKYTYYRRNK